MATRATYQIGHNTFYCHWDGYPAGAAERFANMIAAMTVAAADGSRLSAIEDRRGGFAFAFIRGNMDAEPTLGHDAHGDTEYRYTLTTKADGTAIIEVRERNHDSEFRFSGLYTLDEFINRNGAGKIVTADESRGDKYRKPRTIYATEAAAKAIAAGYARIAARFAEGNPNKPIFERMEDIWTDAILDTAAA